jgi:citrate lyase beta subunit
MRARRALLYMPGDDRHKIEKALTLGVDCICMDMEDGVAPNHKADARRTIAAALTELDFGRTEKLVRINPVGSGLEALDLEAVLPARPAGVVVPKLIGAKQLEWVAGRIESAELAHGWPVNSIGLFAVVERARAVMDLREIAAFPRVQALIFCADDLIVELGAVHTRPAWETFYARSAVVTAAAAYSLQAIDMVFVEYRDVEGLREEAAFGARLGYAGKQVIHPAQVAPVQEAFTPDDDSIARARQMVDNFQAHQKLGIGAFAQDGIMVDMSLVKSAEGVLERARAAGKI